MAKISVAMATYNGAPYLREQLDSLATQTHLPNELVVCDDGSVDATLSIVQAFSLSAPFPVRIYQNEKNLGYSDNFLKAANLCSGEWIAFCDQDDVWLPSKLDAVASAVARNGRISMVLQNAILSDDRLCKRGRLFPNKLRSGTYLASEQYGFWVWPGFLKTVRADWLQALDSASRPLNYFPDQKLQSHDKWTCMVANALGGVCVLGGASAFYRRHDAALTGEYKKKSTLTRVTQAGSVGAEHYRFLADVARSSAAYLEKLVDEVSEVQWQRSFSRAADHYEALASIQDRRADLYATDRFSSRVKEFLRIVRLGGYIGPNFIAMGVSSMAKDATCVLFGPSALSVFR